MNEVGSAGGGGGERIEVEGSRVEFRGALGGIPEGEDVGFLHSETHSLTIGFGRKKEPEMKSLILITRTHTILHVHALK